MSVIAGRVWPTVVLVLPATLLAVGDRGVARHPRGLAARERPDVGTVGASIVPVLDARGLARHGAARRVRGRARPVPARRVHVQPAAGRAGAYVADVITHAFLPVLTLVLAYVGEYVLIMRSSMVEVTPRGLPHDRARQGPHRPRGQAATRRAERAPADRHAGLLQLRLRARRRGRDRVDLQLAGSGAAHVPSHRQSGFPRDPRDLPDVELPRDRVQPGRPTSPTAPSTPGCTSADGCRARSRGRRDPRLDSWRRRARRRRAFGAFRKDYRRNRMGMVGIGILVGHHGRGTARPGADRPA